MSVVDSAATLLDSLINHVRNADGHFIWCHAQLLDELDTALGDLA